MRKSPNDEFRHPGRRRHRISLWTLLAPAALVAVIFALFSALGSSCLLKECASEKADSSKETPARQAEAEKRKAKPFLFDKQGKLKKRWRVREGQNAENIARDFELTFDELKACNPQVLDFRQLSAGQFLQVDHKYCKGATVDDAGAVVDPTAGTPAEVASGGAAGKNAE